MKKFVYGVICSALVASFMGGCAGGPEKEAYDKAQAAYNNGKDDQAMKLVLKSLKEKPDYKPALELLSKIYDDVVGGHRKAVNKLKKSKDPARWDKIVDHEKKIASFNKDLKLVARRNDELGVDIQKNDKDLSKAKDSAAYYNFQYGLEKMEDPSKESQRAAAVNFGKVLEYRPEYPEAEDLYKQCREKGMMRIVVDRLKDDFSGRMHGAIISAMQKDEVASEFISFVSREDLDRLMEEQDMALSGDFLEGSGVDMVGKLLDAQYIVIGSVEKAECAEQPEVETQERDVSASVKTGRQTCSTQTNSKGRTTRKCRDEYMTVSATVTTDTLRRKASVSGTVKLLDVATSEIKKSIDIRAGVMSTGQESRCHGDDRACSKAKIKKSTPLRPCTELADQLVVDFAKKAVKGISAYTIKLAK